MTRTPRTWSLTVEVPAEVADEASLRLAEAGAGGVEERSASLIPMPGERQPAPGHALLLAWFDDVAAAEGARAELGRGGDIGPVEERDWGEEWKRGLAPVDVGRLHLRPTWVESAPPPGSVEVVLDPGMAFGTGTHPTTALCLEAIDDFLARRPGADVLDVGTGSGLLAIAARKLGAGRVAANDDDPVAVRVASENAARNGAELELTGAPVEGIPGRFDLVVANILANVLVDLAPALSERLAPGGELVLAGVLVPQEEEVAAAVRACGLAARPGARRGEWALLRFERPA